MPSSRGSSQLRNRTQSPALQVNSLPSEPPGKRIQLAESIHPLHPKWNLIYRRNHYLKGEGFSGALGAKNLPANAGDTVQYLMGRIPLPQGSEVLEP